MIEACDIDKLSWLRWMFQHGKIGGQSDGVELAPFEARKRVEA